jgi:hypothetical protein
MQIFTFDNLVAVPVNIALFWYVTPFIPVDVVPVHRTPKLIWFIWLYFIELS